MADDEPISPITQEFLERIGGKVVATGLDTQAAVNLYVQRNAALRNGEDPDDPEVAAKYEIPRNDIIQGIEQLLAAIPDGIGIALSRWPGGRNRFRLSLTRDFDLQHDPTINETCIVITALTGVEGVNHDDPLLRIRTTEWTIQ